MSQASRIQDADSEDLAIATRIDSICDDFEKAWRSKRRPKIEDYLENWEGSSRARLVAELLLVDRELRINAGETVGRLEYQRRFPEYSRLIAEIGFPTIDDRLVGQSRLSQANNINFERFQLLEELGHGAFGTVWKARDTKLERYVAIKTTERRQINDTERTRLMREARAIAQLRHPNIVRVFEVGEEKNGTFIVCELVSGSNLRDWLLRNRPDAGESAELVARIADALHHAHEQGVIHRDLKPSNVLIDGDHHPYVTDFGLAKWAVDSGEWTVEGNVLGTPAYMPPEQARGQGLNADRRCDVYGLGALLYELLTGRPPFAGELTTIIHQVIHEDPPRPRVISKSIPRDLETICLKAMEKDASRRYPTAAEMALDLRRYLRGETLATRRVSGFERCYRWVRRRPSVAATIALLAILCIAGIVIAALKQQNYRLEGYREVEINTAPPGARIAIVPIDPKTGELVREPQAIIRPSGSTPLSTELKPGDYFIEAVLPNIEGIPDFAETSRTVPPRGNSPTQGPRSNRIEDDNPMLFNIRIRRTAEITASMVPVRISESLRRQDSLLPEIIYVEKRKVSRVERKSGGRGDEGTGVGLDFARRYAESQGQRLPSAREYEAIKRSLEFSSSIRSSEIMELGSGLPEWTTSLADFTVAGHAVDRARLRNMYILTATSYSGNLSGGLRLPDGRLVAPADCNSPDIAFRGVRSSAPRFLNN